MIGEEIPSPGIAAFQRMFLSSLHSIGGLPVGDTPDPNGPRQLLQDGSSFNRVWSWGAARAIPENNRDTEQVRAAFMMAMVTGRRW